MNSQDLVNSKVAQNYQLAITHDPSLIATFAVKGTIAIGVGDGAAGGKFWQKQDNGLSVNWSLLGGAPAVPDHAAELFCVAPTIDVVTGVTDGYFRAPSIFNDQTIYDVFARVIVAGITNNTVIQIERERGGWVSVLSTPLRIDSGQFDSITSVVPPVIDLANDDILTADLFRFNVSAVSVTAPKGLIIGFQARS